MKAHRLRAFLYTRRPSRVAGVRTSRFLRLLEDLTSLDCRLARLIPSPFGPARRFAHPHVIHAANLAANGVCGRHSSSPLDACNGVPYTYRRSPLSPLLPHLPKMLVCLFLKGKNFRRSRGL